MKEVETVKNKVRVNIGVDFERCRECRDFRGLKEGAEAATFIMCYVTILTCAM